MDLQTTLLSALSTYGVVAIFVSILVSSIGLPLPTSFLLIVAGSFVETGDLSFWPVVGAALAGSVIGDHLGYAIGRVGGRPFAERTSARFGATALMARAEVTTTKWGGVTVFFSRWLITAIGPWVNLISGITRQKMPIFSWWDVVGEALWVLIYVYIGRLFGDKISEISDALGDFSGVLAALVVLGILITLLVRSRRAAAPALTTTTESAYRHPDRPIL